MPMSGRARRMDAVEPLDADDYESVNRAARTLHEQGWRKAFTLNEMMAAWRSLVREVELGYDQMVEEYTNDLSCRDCWHWRGRCCRSMFEASGRRSSTL